jgi:hypothetical protein
MNGITYTTSGSYSVVNGCQTTVLNLTITPSTTSTQTASACDSYTWSMNGITYTTSGSYSVVSGCQTSVLNLTITPSTTSTQTASACNSYTWSMNGTTYTTSGSYSVVIGCQTTVLNLVIHTSTTSTNVQTACSSYTWLANGVTYTASGIYTATLNNASGCDSLTSISLTINNCATILNIKAFLEGYYYAGSMQPVLYNQSVSSDLTLTDTIEVSVYESTSPYTQLVSQKVILKTDGTVICSLPPLSGQYFIGLRSRNIVSTWSANPILLGTTPAYYDFTISSSQAFGDNMKEVEPGVWACFTGDFNHDENVDLADLGILEDDISNFQFGYFATDINGDGNVDLLDNQTVSDNISVFIYSAHP